jgi:hypothetical protein
MAGYLGRRDGVVDGALSVKEWRSSSCRTINSFMAVTD